jgi:hypothetical protein
MDYRPHPQRVDYFHKLYDMNLKHGIMPGLVYLYMPALKSRFNWTPEQALWFAFLNGMTQNPLTSLLMMHQLSDCPDPDDNIEVFDGWFNLEWPRLFFDTDRLKNKRNTVPAIKSYARLVGKYGSQVEMLSEKSYTELWDLVSTNYYSFGRLSTFSYLEYVKIMGYGTACQDLMFWDKDGSKSHRNGMLFLMGMDHLVNDKRANNGFDGKYEDYDKMCDWLAGKANGVIKHHLSVYPHPDVGYFTFESQLCQFKNHFFGRRYGGVYADMAYERLLKHEEAWGKDKPSAAIWQIREELPRWLRNEAHNDKLSIPDRAKIFPRTGFPYRGEHFL